jgi:UDP-N-acetylglucosamine acyltransferase
MHGIDPTAVVSPSATLADDVTIGAYAVVGSNVTLDPGVIVHHHAVVDGAVTIGAGTEIFPFATVGMRPQHRGDTGAHGRAVIGRNCVIREYATVHVGTDSSGRLTTVGDGCYLMIGAHVAHDCRLGDNVTIANNVALGGHVEVGEGAYLGGLSAIHQHVHIGRFTMIPGGSRIGGNVAPFALVLPSPSPLGGTLRGPNIVGLRRNGFSRESIRDIGGGMRCLFGGSASMADRIRMVEDKYNGNPHVQEMIDFVQNRGVRGFLKADFRDDR